MGRDKIVITAETPPEDLLLAYNRSLAAECRRLPLGIIDKEFVRASRVRSQQASKPFRSPTSTSIWT